MKNGAGKYYTSSIQDDIQDDIWNDTHNMEYEEDFRGDCDYPNRT